MRLAQHSPDVVKGWMLAVVGSSLIDPVSFPASVIRILRRHHHPETSQHCRSFSVVWGDGSHGTEVNWDSIVNFQSGQGKWPSACQEIHPRLAFLPGQRPCNVLGAS